MQGGVDMIKAASLVEQMLVNNEWSTYWHKTIRSRDYPAMMISYALEFMGNRGNLVKKDGISRRMILKVYGNKGNKYFLIDRIVHDGNGRLYYQALDDENDIYHIGNKEAMIVIGGKIIERVIKRNKERAKNAD
jgi:hypothetical protein